MLEDIVAMVLIFGGGTLAVLAFSPLGKALASRIRFGKELPTAPEVDEALYDEVDQLRLDVNEMRDRLDFAERLLTSKAESSQEEAT